MPLTVEIVTAEKLLSVEENVDVLIAPGTEGELGILPRHAPLMTTLAFGVLEMRRGDVTDVFAIQGGFMEVRNDHVIVLADAAEAAEDIDIERAQAARDRAEAELRGGPSGDEGTMNIDAARARAAMLRSLARLRAAERVQRRTRTR